jgi:hypothetical protein
VKSRITGGIALLVIAAVFGGCSSLPEESGSASKGGAESKSSNSDKKKKSSCGTRATDDCTPRVGENRKVRVDALYWQVNSVKTAKTLGDMTYGLGEMADGIFVVVDLKVRSAKSESVTLTDNVFQLEIGGKTYDTDSDGTVAAIGAGDDPIFLEDIGPDATTSGTVVFDVPKSALKKKVAMRFNELGFGTTHGYIKLSSLGA